MKRRSVLALCCLVVCLQLGCISSRAWRQFMTLGGVLNPGPPPECNPALNISQGEFDIDLDWASPAARLENRVTRCIRLGYKREALALLDRVFAVYEARNMREIDVERYATSVGNVGFLYRLMGRGRQAEEATIVALQLLKRSGNRDLQMRLQANLCSVYAVQGRYNEADVLARHLLAELQSSKSIPLVERLFVTDCLATVHKDHGQIDQADILVRDAFNIAKQDTSESRSYFVSTMLQRLALIAFERGQLDEAEALLQQQLALHPAAQAGTNSEVARIRMGQGSIARARGQHSEAIEYYEDAKEMFHLREGDSMEVAHVLDREVLSYLALNQLSDAESAARGSLKLSEDVLGAQHVLVATPLEGLATVLLARGQEREALSHLWRALALREALLSETLSEPRALALLQNQRPAEDVVYSQLALNAGQTDLARFALTLALYRKGRMVDVGAQASVAHYRNPNGSDEQAMWASWQALRAERERLLLAGSASLSRQEYEEELKILKLRIEILEQKMANMALHQPRQHGRLPGPRELLGEVARRLPRNGALIEIVTAEPPAHLQRTGATPQAASYVALVLLGNATVSAVHLGSASEIDRAVEAFRTALQNPKSDVKAAAGRMYQLLLEPLAAGLRGVTQLWVAPDGALSLIPFDALFDGRAFLIDRYTIHYVTSGRDLLRSPEGTHSRGSLVLAAPDFQLKAVRSTNPQARLERGASEQRYSALLSSLPPLPGTRTEAQLIGRLLATTPLLGAQATDRALLSAHAPRVLHIATHGLFLDDVASGRPGSRGGIWRSMPIAVPAAGGMSDALTASAHAKPSSAPVLIMAGAAYAKDAVDTTQDGVVTDEEIRGMNLWGTQLVVLSACNTGQGIVQRGHGVQGLRRSFIAAGAETLVVSLWQVPDEETSQLMQSFYQHLVGHAAPRVAALRQAMHTLRTKRQHPYFWAPFIAIGMDRPLR